MTEPEESKDKKRREVRRLVDYSVIGLVFPVAMVLGFVAGQWIGGWFGRDRLGGVVGGLFGIVAGFYNVYKTVAKLNDEGPGDTPPS